MKRIVTILLLAILTSAAAQAEVNMGVFTASGDFECSATVGSVTSFSITKHFEDEDGRMVIECASVQCEVAVSTLKPGQYVGIAGVIDADKDGNVTHRAMDIQRQ